MYKRQELDIRPTMGMDNPYNYRNRAQMPVGYDEDGVMVGFYSMNSRELVNVTAVSYTHLLALNKIIPSIKSIIFRMYMSPSL